MVDTSPTKKSLGQHWLNDVASLLHIVESAELTGKDQVVEIGPGNGALTRLLVVEAGKVVAVEYDRHLFDALPAKVPAENLDVIHADILNIDFDQFSSGYKIVANIPYYLTSNLIRKITESSTLPDLVVLLIQKEVAERLCARTGAMSLLSVAAQLYFETQLGNVVPADAFYPAPKVDSQVVILHKLKEPKINKQDEVYLFRLAKMAFNGKRKTLLNTLSAGLAVPKQDLKNNLSEFNIDLGSRPQQYSIEDWIRLVNACKVKRLV